MKLVYVKWQDACSNSAWHTKSGMEEWFKKQDYIVEQVGWLAFENKRYIGIICRKTNEDTNEAEYGMLQKIPKTWIIKKTELKIK